MLEESKKNTNDPELKRQLNEEIQKEAERLRKQRAEYDSFVRENELKKNAIRTYVPKYDAAELKGAVKAYKANDELNKNLNIGSLKNVNYVKNYAVANISREDMQQIKKAISNIGKTYNIELDYFEVGDYTDDMHIDSPMFYRAVDNGGKYESKLVVNNACAFWSDKKMQKYILNSGYFAGSSIEDFTNHEIAHVLTFQKCKTYREAEKLSQALYKEYVSGVSEYNMEMRDGAETIAEAFVQKQKGIRVRSGVQKLLDKYVEVHKKC